MRSTRLIQVKKILFGLFLVLTVNMAGQSPNWAWAQAHAGPGLGGEGINAITHDNFGNIIYTGTSYSSSLNFGSQNYTTPGSGGDIFVAKSDTNNNLIWVKLFGSSQIDWSTSITTDTQGNIYLAGYFDGATTTFGSITLINDSSGKSDMMLVKLSPNGNVIWAKNWGGKNSDELNKIIYDQSSNTLIGCGYFKSKTMNFGTTQLTNDTTNYSSDIFVVKIDTSGNPIWAKSYGGNDNETATAITSDLNGNIYLAANFKSDNITVGATNYSIMGGNDLLLVKLSPVGNLIWSNRKSTGNVGNLIAESIAVDANNQLYISGNYGISVTFGNQTLNVVGGQDAFLLATDANASPLWSKNLGSSFIDFAKNVELDQMGNVIVSGFFGGDSLRLNLANLPSAGGYDNFVAKYSNTGQQLWGVRYGGSGFDYCYSISAYKNSVYVAGKFLSSSIVFGTNTINGVGGADIFVAKLSGGTLVSINENSFDNEISIFPNPFSETISIKKVNNLEKTHYIISDFSGRIYIDTYKKNDKIKIISPDLIEINLKDLSSGMYLITEIKNGEKAISRKIIKN